MTSNFFVFPPTFFVLSNHRLLTYAYYAFGHKPATNAAINFITGGLTILTPGPYNEFIGGGTSEEAEEAGVVLAVWEGEDSRDAPWDTKEKAGKLRGGRTLLVEQFSIDGGRGWGLPKEWSRCRALIFTCLCGNVVFFSCNY